MKRLIDWLKWQLGIDWKITVDYSRSGILGTQESYRIYRNVKTGERRRVYYIGRP